MSLLVDVAAGTVQINGAAVAVADDTFFLAVADTTYARFDLIVADDAGAVTPVTGTPDPTPVFPAIPADSVVLAAVWVPPNESDIHIGNIVDKRVLVPRSDYLEMHEISAPASAPANAGRLYAEDNGSGKTRLVVKFASGVAQVIATEP